MAPADRRLAFAAFLVSGFCALLYQVIWIRLAFARFGIIMPVASVVVSVFMAGNGIGAWAGGRLAGRLREGRGPRPLTVYAAAEAAIGVGSITVPALMAAGGSLLLGLGAMDSLPYLLLTAVALTIALLPWSVMMGATFPLMMAHLRATGATGAERSFSLLYLANVVGAMAGAFASAFVLVELLGFTGTLAAGGILNLCIAAACAWRSRASGRPAPGTEAPPAPAAPPAATVPAALPRGTSVILLTTGFTTMAFEIVWTRMFTPVLLTSVYAFAGILIAYLAATWAGSGLYRACLSRGRTVPRHAVLAVAAAGAFLPAVLNDPRWFSDPLGTARAVTCLASIVPFCVALGFLTPRLIDEGAKGAPEAAGRLYAVNVAGCIAGPLAASYLLLPLLGAKLSLVLLGTPFLLLLLAVPSGAAPRARLAAAAPGIALLAVSATVVVNNETPWPGSRALIARDYAATVTCTAFEGAQPTLLVNGVGITILSPITKHMAHLPLVLLPRAPESGLVICFGMGTTWRSMMSWGIDATAVELVPSVRDVFGFFHDDAAALVADPRGRIVIDDGRRFLMRAGRDYDVITIDPPPPVEASGSSLLYSDEFYRLARRRMRPGGILQQWCPLGGEGGRIDPVALQAVARSIADAFPHVRAFASAEGWGVHFLASGEPIVVPPAGAAAARMPGAAAADLLEWSDSRDPRAVLEGLLERAEIPMADLLPADPRIRITDDRPLNEYFLLRRLGAER